MEAGLWDQGPFEMKIWNLLAGEGGLALFEEGGDALVEVFRAAELALDLRLELEVLGHPGVQPVVELALAARVGPWLRRSSRSSARSAKSSSGQTALIRPMSTALVAVTGSPSSAISAARATPMRDGTERDAPPSGARPLLTNASEK